MWPFSNKRRVACIPTCTIDSESGICIVDTEEVITRRDRLPIDAVKLEILHALLDVVANEDLDAVFVSLLSEVSDLGYNLQDEPEALLAQVKRSF